MKGRDLYKLLRNAGALTYSKEPKETEDGTVLTGDFQVIANKNYNIDTDELDRYVGVE